MIDAFAAGLVLGVVYCALLWFAVQRLSKAQHPVLWLIGSAVPRLGIPLAGFYWVMDGQWERLIVCLTGFVLARLVVQQCVKSHRAGRQVGT